jgi:hypothetical protein
MNEAVRERLAVALAAIPVAFVLSVIMRIVAAQCHLETPGWLFVEWFVPGYVPKWLSGPALYYLVLVDLGFCWVIVLGIYWFVYKRFYDVEAGN